MPHGIVIVGAGECGTRAAFALRQEGYSLPITLIGAEAHAPYERPPLSKSSRLDGPTYIASKDRYETEDILLLRSTLVDRIDPEAHIVHLAHKQIIPYDSLLLTTGAKARMLPGVSEVSPRIRTMRTFDDASGIRPFLRPDNRILVVGGGFIGLELAAAARQTGAEVIVLETQERVLSRGVPAKIATAIVERHQKEGVEFACNVRIVSLEDVGSRVEVELADGRTIAGDLAVVGIGARPNTELAEAAGAQIDNGIAVNERLETSLPDVYAAGDCCSFPISHYGRRIRLEAWRNAQDQGTLAAKVLTGKTDTISHVPWMWSDQYDLTLQVAGLSDGATKTVRREINDGGEILFHLDENGRLLAATGIGVGNSIAKDMRIAEMLIARCASPDAASLSEPIFKLKSLLPR